MMRRFDARGRAMCEFGLNELCRTPKLGECDLLYGSKSPADKRGVNDTLKPAEHATPWAACS